MIVDLAADQGENCALTQPDREVVKDGVVIIGARNLPSTMPTHASEIYARTVTSFLNHLLQDGRIRLDLEDVVTSGSLVTHLGEIVHEAVKARL